MEPVEFVEAGLLLRTLRPDDVDAIHLAGQDPEIQRWTNVPSPFLREHAHAFVTERAPRWLAEDAAVHLGAFDPDSGDLLGSVALSGLDPAAGVGHVGYWTARHARGRGVAERATRAVARWAFGPLGLRRISWRAQIGNHASRLVALRLGVRMEGVQRAVIPLRDGGLADAWIGSLLPGDLAEPPPGGAMTGRAEPGPAGPGSLEARRAKVFGAVQPTLTARAADAPVTLRQPVVADVDGLIAACRDPESIRWTTVPDPYRRADAESFVDHARNHWARGQGAVFALADADEAYAGSMALRIYPADPVVADVGFMVSPHARGRGYAPAALGALCAWGFDRLGLTRIEWRAHVGNEASRRVAVKAGFTLEGVARSGLAHRGERRDAWVGALLATDRGASSGTHSATDTTDSAADRGAGGSLEVREAAA